jgi:hypothetical protein
MTLLSRRVVGASPVDLSMGERCAHVLLDRAAPRCRLHDICRRHNHLFDGMGILRDIRTY